MKTDLYGHLFWQIHEEVKVLLFSFGVELLLQCLNLPFLKKFIVSIFSHKEEPSILILDLIAKRFVLYSLPVF